jgi:lysophospholipase L1-like esterase
VEGTDHVLTFSGSKTVTIPPGAPMVSDPVDIKVAARGDLAVSFFVSAPTPIDTYHWDAEQTGFIVGGNEVSAATFDNPTKTTVRIFLSDILVEAPAGARAIVAFGDSITDGAASGVDQDARWPDFMADNLAPLNVAVLNAGISGARLLQSKMGENAMARFDRDVLAKPNVAAVVVLMGINDIACPGQTFAPNDPFPTKDELVAGYRQLLARAHMRGIRVVVGTLTPFRNALKGSPLEGYYTEPRNKLRKEVNDWIRSSGEFDAVVDFDKLVQAPSSPDDIADVYQADHLHLSAAGNKLVADALTPYILFGEK